MSKSEGAAGVIGGRARTAIRGSGLAQRDVALRIGVNESKLSKSLGGTRRFSADELLALATATGVTVRWLLDGTDGAGGGTDASSGADASGAAHGNATTAYAQAMAATATPPPESLPATHAESHEHALTRRTIVEQAWWLFAEHGYDSVRISDIAEAAAVSSPSVHYYFPSKRDIFTEALRYSVKLAFDRQSARLIATDDPADRLTELVHLQLPSDRLRRAEWSIWLQTWSSIAVSGDRFEHEGSYRRWWQTVRGIVSDGRRTGVFAVEDPDRVADELTALIDGLGIRVLTGMLGPDGMAEQIGNYIQRNLVHHVRTAP